MGGAGIVSLINTVTGDVTTAAWALFILAWASGWGHKRISDPNI
ncbi:hypothetical protein RQ359_000156 [Sulfuracidifex metallicus DSM 6482 = JCM 9184]|nr:hypothetical protein RQ359_000156 [Sulfuracidifex metallicus DSM 6482 = JCM 9184]